MPPAALFASMPDDTTLWRDGLVDTVRAMPGASTREVSRAAGISEWTADYHLRRKLREGVLTTENVGRTRRWYVKGCGLCPVLKRAIPALRRPEAQALALAAEDYPETLPRLANRAGVPIGTARWVTNVLEDAFLLERTGFGRLFLRRGAQTCIGAATNGRRCELWGKCPVSRAWTGPADDRATETALEQGQSTRSRPR